MRWDVAAVGAIAMVATVGCSALLDVGALSADGAGGAGSDAATAGGDDGPASSGSGDASGGDDGGSAGEEGGTAFDAGDGAAAISYADAVKSDGPVVYWRFRETSSAAPAKDEMGHYDGTWQGTPSLGATGPFAGSTAVAIAGTDEAMTVAPGFLSLTWTEMTLEGWGAASTAATEGWFFGWDVADGTGCSFGLFRDNPSLHLVFHDHTCAALTSTTVPTLNTFYYVVVTLDASNVGRLYVNGALESQATIAGRPPTGHFLVAANEDAVDGGGVRVTDVWRGSLAELAIYDKALSPARVASHYAAAHP